MSGWQRFFLLIICCAGVLICWPQYNKQGLSFMLMAFCLWTCLIILLSIFINLFALYKVELLHRLISLVFMVVLMGSLLYFFPLEDGQTPVLRMQNNQWPTLQDMQKGLNKLTFHFNFVQQYFSQNSEPVHHKKDTIAEQVKTIQEQVQQPLPELEVLLDAEEEKE